MWDPEYLIRAQNIAIVVANSQLQTEYLNPAAEALLDISDSRAHGKPLDKVIGKSGEICEIIVKVLEFGQTYTLREAHLYSPSMNIELLLDCTVSPLHQDEGGDGILLEMWRVDNLVRLSRDSWLNDRQSATRSMIRGLAHEIKNPLGGLRGAAQLLDRELPPGELREFTRIITHEADRLTTLVDRMTAPYMQIKRERLNLHELLEHVFKLVQVEVQGRITIYRDYDPSLPDIVAERDGLTQVFLNIVRNATQAITGKGRITMRTRIGRRQSVGGKLYRQVLKVEIVDDGPGVPEELLDKIFFPLVTGRADGTGLGLSLAQEIVSRHHGRIECNSSPGNTQFIVTLPRDQADE